MQNGESLGDKSEAPRVDPPADRASRAATWAILGAATGALVSGPAAPVGAAIGGLVGAAYGALVRDSSLRF